MWHSLNIYWLILLIIGCVDSTFPIVKDFIQFNLAGHPVLHQETRWNFDPNLGPKRSTIYQEANGIHGEKAIERLGLGIDGKQSHRLVQQKARDKRLLNQTDTIT